MIIGMLSAIDQNHWPPSIGMAGRFHRNPQVEHMAQGLPARLQIGIGTRMDKLEDARLLAICSIGVDRSRSNRIGPLRRAPHRHYALEIRFDRMVHQKQASRRYDAASDARGKVADHWRAPEKMDTMVAELVSFLQALKSGGLIGYLILLALVLIVLALVVVALVYQRIVNRRFKAASKATQENH